MSVARAGAVADAGGQKQHVDLYRKLLLRRELTRDALPGTAVYAPYIGDGDMAVELYSDRLVLGADLDAERVATAASRLPTSDVRVADCEGPYPFADRTEPIGIADLDAYGNPYLALLAFWSTAPRAERVVIFGTDGMRMAIRVSRTRMLPALPASSPLGEGTFAERRHQYNSWWSAYVRPFVEATVAPWTIAREAHYMRSHMDYWGVVLDPPGAAPIVKTRRDGWSQPGEVKRQTSAHYRDQVAKRVAKRARKVPAIPRPVRLAILERDEWTCWICGKAIDRALRWPNKDSHSIDHVTAVENGGTNDPENLRAAHLGCNGRKRNAVVLAVAETPAAPDPEADPDVAAVESALREAAMSGNVPAALAWLEAKAPGKWGRVATARMTPEQMARALGYED